MVCGKNQAYRLAMATARPEWGDWLRQQFDTHPAISRPVDLVRKAGLKDNGRPRIDASSITQWLRGRRPSYELAVLAAGVFGRPAEEALHAAGYDQPVSTPAPATSVLVTQPEFEPELNDPFENDEILAVLRRDTKLHPEARAHLINQYQLLRRISEPADPGFLAEQEQRRQDAEVERRGAAKLASVKTPSGRQKAAKGVPERRKPGLR